MQGRRKKYSNKSLVCKALIWASFVFAFTSKTCAQDFEYGGDGLLILEPKIQNYTLDDYAYVYEKNGKDFISLPQLASYTGFKYEKEGSTYKISWALTPSNVLINLVDRSIEVDGIKQMMEPNDVKYIENTLFVSTSFLERVFKIKTEIDYLNMSMSVDALQDFPTTIKKNLEKNRAGGLYSYQRDSFKDYDFDNRWFGAPVLDVTLGKGWNHNKNGMTSNSDNYALNFAGIAAGLDVTAYLSGDSARDRKPTARITGSREFLEEPGNPLLLKRMEIGDVSGVNNSYFTNSSYGRGISLSSFKDLILSADKTIDITGPLQEGWQVELYWNDQLMGYRQNGVAGRYNFENLPVSYGLNTFKLMFYGPYGETRTEYKRYYSGTSPVKKGEFGYTIDAFQPERYLIEDHMDLDETRKTSKSVFDMTGYYGLTDNLTLMSGYTQTPDYEHTSVQNFGMAGMQYAIDGLSVQYNLERNLDTDRMGQHIEAQGDVYIGTIFASADNYNKIHSPISARGNDYMENAYEARLSGLLPYNMPYYVSYRFGSYEDSPQKFHDVSTRISKQVKHGINLTLENTYYHTTHGGEDRDEVQFGAYKWWGNFSSEAWITYDVKPDSEFKEFRLRGDWRTGRRTYLTAEYIRDLRRDMDSIAVSAGKVFDFGGLTLTLRADRDKNISAYLTYNISFAKEPDRINVFATGNSRFGETGSVYVNLKDENGEPLEGVGLNANGLEKEVYTDESGHALLPDLQTYEKTIVVVDDETLPDIALYPEKEEQKLVLRPGTIRTVDINFVHKGAVEGRLENTYDHMMFGYEISAYDENGEQVLSTFADTDGYFVLEGLKYGTYKLVVTKDGINLGVLQKVVVDDVLIYLDNEIDLNEEPLGDEEFDTTFFDLNEFDDDYEYKLSEKRAEDLGVESVSDDEDIQQKAAQELEEIEITEQKSVNDEEFNVSQEPETKPQEFNVSQEPETEPQEFNVSQEPETKPQEFNVSQEPETKPQEFNVSHKGQEKTKNFHVSMLNQ